MKVYLFKFLMEVLLQTRCIIINPVLNSTTNNIENDILKHSKKKTKMMKNPPSKYGSRFIKQSYSSHATNGKRKSRPYLWSEAVREYICRDIIITWIFC